MGKSSVAILLTLTLSGSFACSTTTQTSVTAPDTQKCQVAVGGPSAAFAATGGTGVVNVSAARECSWTATASATWISINGAAGGQGDGSVSYSVAANQVPSPRSAALAVASATVQLSQAAAPCLYSLSRTRETVPAAGGQVRVDVSTLTGCTWTATSADLWMTVVSGQNGSAGGTVTLTVAANSGAARVGHASIAGQSVSVSQNGLTDQPPTPAPPPASVHLEGTVLFVLGRCPILQFVVNGTPIVTDASTDFRKKTKCTDLRAGVEVSVDGTREDATVRARTVEIRNQNDD